MTKTGKKPASENLWYVLATLASEHAGQPNSELEKRNRAYWNAWASQGMTEEEKADVKNADGNRLLTGTPDWKDVEKEIEDLFQERLPNAMLPDPLDDVDFKEVAFSKPVSFLGFFFPKNANFSSAEFSEYTSFRRAAFSGSAFFDSAKFSKKNEDFDFSSTAFSGYANFSSAKFWGHAVFDSAKFSRNANFCHAKFSGKTSFYNAEFSGLTGFERAVFSKEASFAFVVFSRKADFYHVKFSADTEDTKYPYFTTDFTYAAFSGDAFFHRAKFFGKADFSSTAFSGSSKFINTIFEQTTLFTDAMFEKPCNMRGAEFKTTYPDLEGTLLHSHTNMTADKKHWPTAQIEQSNEAAVQSCAHLRQNMASQGLHEAAHFFFRREMAHKAKLAKCWELPFYWLYAFAKYGYGVWQPLSVIAILGFGGAGALAYWGCLNISTALGLSFANIFKFFGFQRVYFDADIIQGLNCWLKVMTGAQTVIGYLLLFLLGLGLRNRFRLK